MWPKIVSFLKNYEIFRKKKIIQNYQKKIGGPQLWESLGPYKRASTFLNQMGAGPQ